MAEGTGSEAQMSLQLPYETSTAVTRNTASRLSNDKFIDIHNVTARHATEDCAKTAAINAIPRKMC
jgi:hypothetical protein